MKQIKEIHQSLRESMHGGRPKSWSTWQLANTISYLLLLYIGSDPCFKIGIVSICCIGISEWHWLYIGIAPWIRIGRDSKHRCIVISEWHWRSCGGKVRADELGIGDRMGEPRWSVTRNKTNPRRRKITGNSRNGRTYYITSYLNWYHLWLLVLKSPITWHNKLNWWSKLVFC